MPGAACPKCGSPRREAAGALRPKPNVLWVILIGWIYLLVRFAFVKREVKCADCGEYYRYRTVASMVALVLVMILLAALVTGYFAEP